MLTALQLFLTTRSTGPVRSQAYLDGQFAGMECASIDRAIVSVLCEFAVGTAEFDAWWAGFHAGHTAYLMARSEFVHSAPTPPQRHLIHDRRSNLK